MSKLDTCPECGAMVVTRHSQYGTFIGCSAYPQCKWTASVNFWQDTCRRNPEEWKRLREIVLENACDKEHQGIQAPSELDELTRKQKIEILDCILRELEEDIRYAKIHRTLWDWLDGINKWLDENYEP